MVSIEKKEVVFGRSHRVGFPTNNSDEGFKFQSAVKLTHVSLKDPNRPNRRFLYNLKYVELFLFLSGVSSNLCWILLMLHTLCTTMHVQLSLPWTNSVIDPTQGRIKVGRDYNRSHEIHENLKKGRNIFGRFYQIFSY